MARTAIERLEALIRQAEAGSLDPKDCAATALAIGRDALQQQRVYTNKHGDESIVPQPDNKAALAALETAGRFAGLLLAEAKRPKRDLTATEDEAALLDVARAELNARGYDVVPRVRQ